MIKPSLEVYRAEIKGMPLTEYKVAEAIEMFKEGGCAERVIVILVPFVQKGVLSIKDDAVQAGATETVYQQRMVGK